MAFETIKFEKQDGYCIITLNRPKSLNALNVKMWTELTEAINLIDNDDSIKAFIFTGAPRPDGRPCFCSGADLKEMAGNTSGGVLKEGSSDAPATVTLAKPSWTKNFWSFRQPKPTMVPTFERITWSPKISIAAIDGVCTAGGTELALACDLTIVSETAKISDMHVKNLGWIGGMRLAAIIMTKATIRSVQDMDRRSSLRYCDEAFSILLSEKDTADFGPERWTKDK
jgi:enoyl-CoA hydratase/carnithine racemase